MEILKDIPEQKGIVHKVERVTFNIIENNAYVEILVPDNTPRSVAVNIQPLIDAATTTQKNIIKGFFKNIIAEALVTDAANIPDVL